ncbi:hypothetical protein WK15_19860 [Burkholderia ubonensis]|uniref:Uncharacterized protein n=1 Tax=Burkholderia ubonensis TaxID=101571 RepID=A0AA40RET5_9BURK|nr:hypothetical protein [Burkholderia ubonensis]KVC91534.1 hypothetical protein WI77_13785 [Burkholderia ubonensis]KVD63507.1 hypothetical protein WI87_06035 [Burkholderia ubonensis]KVD82085.1 hypothetical protein WI88_18410 [Burkholderia ubonensis]KVM71845.1 hypothetical protein WJ61_19055 [Burkholderia ubonensis]KVO60872.1 hypothetical protein WJ77_08200 [Burkholderia ubonensis]
MPFRLTSRLSRAAKRVVPSVPLRPLRHHRARAQALAVRTQQPARLDGIRAWFHAFFSLMSAQALARRTGLRSLLQKPSSLRALALRRAGGPQRRINRPRRLAASTGWFAFAAR